MNPLTFIKRWILLPGSETERRPADRPRRGFRVTNLADLFHSPYDKGPGRPALLPVPVPARSARRPYR